MNATPFPSKAFDQRINGDNSGGELTDTAEQSAVIVQLLHDMVRSLEEKNNDADTSTDSRPDPAARDVSFGPTPKTSGVIRSAHESFLTYLADSSSCFKAASSKKLRLSYSNEKHAVEKNCDVSVMSHAPIDGLAATAVLNEEAVEEVFLIGGGMENSIRPSQQPEPHQLNNEAIYNCQSHYGQHLAFDEPLQQVYIDMNTDHDVAPSDHLPLVDEAMNDGIPHCDDLPIVDEEMNDGITHCDDLPPVDEAMKDNIAHCDDLPPVDEAMNDENPHYDDLPIVDEAMNDGIPHYDDLPPVDEEMNEGIPHCDDLPPVDEAMNDGIPHNNDLPIVDEAMKDDIPHYDDHPTVDEEMNDGIPHYDDLPPVDEAMKDDIPHCDDLPPVDEAMKDDIPHCDDLPTVDEAMNDGIAQMVGYSTSSASASKDARHEDFQSLWLQRKQLVEAEAEAKARQLFRQRQRDQVSLEASIDSSLREYGDMHEQAHALRLQFEDEKHRWMTTVLETARTAENTPGKRQRVSQSSPYSYYRDHTQQQQQYSRAGSDGSSWTGDDLSSTPGGCEDLHVQFQYEVDLYEAGRFEPQLPAPGDNPLHLSSSSSSSRHGKRQKRFLVPIKVKVQE